MEADPLKRMTPGHVWHRLSDALTDFGQSGRTSTRSLRTALCLTLSLPIHATAPFTHRLGKGKAQAPVRLRRAGSHP